MSGSEELGHWKKNKADRGLILRGRVWYIRYRDQNGNTRVERVGPSKTLALKAYQKRKTEVAERRFFPASGVLWDELVKDVLAKERQKHEWKTGEPFKPGVKGIVQQWFAGRKADSISADEIAEKLADIKTPATYNRKFYALNKIFRIGIKSKKITLNPMMALNAAHEDNARVRYLNQYEPDEEQHLRDAIRKLCPEREAEVDLALNTGMRWKEQYKLLWKNVDVMRTSQITLLATKSGKKQYIPVNAAARAALARLRALYPQSDFVCGGAGYYNDFKRKFWQLVVTEAKIKDLHWHDLRHTFASRLVMAGVDIFTVSKLMRHGDVKTTQRYAHLSPEHLTSAIEKLDSPSVTASDTANRKASVYSIN